MTSSTAFRIFPPSLMHSLNVFLQDVGSGKSVSCIVWENTLPSICILKRLLYTIYTISRESVEKQGFWKPNWGGSTPKNPKKPKPKMGFQTIFGFFGFFWVFWFFLEKGVESSFLNIPDHLRPEANLFFTFFQRDFT